MKNRLLSFLFYFIATISFYAQKNNYKLINFFKAYQLDSVSVLLDKNPSSFSKQVFINELSYLKKGEIKKIEILKPINYIDSVLYYYHLGNYYIRKTVKNDTLSYKNFKSCLELAKKNQDTAIINITLQKINRYFLTNDKDKNLNALYIYELNKYPKDRIDNFWVIYYNIVYDMTYSSFSKEEVISLEKRYLELLKKTPKNTYFEFTLNNMISIFYTYTNDDKKVRKYCQESILSYQNKNYFSVIGKTKASINLAICDYEDRNYQTSIDSLKKLLNNQFIKNKDNLKYYMYDWIYKSYKKLNNKDSSQYYLELSIVSKEKMNQYYFAEKIRDIDVKYKVKETKQQLKNSQNKNKKLNSKMNTILPILAIITLLLGVVFILFKKYYKKTEHLEIEKFETIKKIDELKQIVVKNHIVLKDKTKVYIADLLYIKADDHYLKIYLSNGKDHFVRGKLNKIIEELPPNFIRSHRSFVVNRNFVKQINNANIVLVDKTEIPLSRTYKERF